MASDNREEFFRPNVGKWWLVLFISLIFVAIGYWIISTPGVSGSVRFAGYAGIVFFGLGCIVSLIQFIPNSSFLHVDADGITMRSMWRNKFYRWSDIDQFGVAEFSIIHHGISQRHRLVGFNFSESYKGQSKARVLKSINKNLTGFEAALPENYGWDYARLAEHLNRLKEIYSKISFTQQEEL